MEVASPRPAFRSFYNNHYLVDMVASMCPWYTVVAISCVDTNFRHIMQRLVKTRILHFLTKFIPSERIPMFFDLLDRTNAAVVGSLVRCMMSIDSFDCHYREVYPNQLNIVVPFLPGVSTFENCTLNFRKWHRFLTECRFRDSYGYGTSHVPFHLRATTKTWALFHKNPVDDMRVSLMQSNTSSALSPILQSSHSSNFFALSSTRIYCLYPKLFAQKVNVCMKSRLPPLDCAFDSFNYGLVSFTRTDTWEFASSGGCGEACPSVWRRTSGLERMGVFRWGGYNGFHDAGVFVSWDEGYGNRNEIWKVHGECCNKNCPYITVSCCAGFLLAFSL